MLMTSLATRAIACGIFHTPEARRNVSGTRPLLLHYHFFKCAGTSVEQILYRNFSERWIREEFPEHPAFDQQAAIRARIQGRPDVCAISTHTLHLPPPAIDGVLIIPIVFVRHPLDRAYSAYLYHRTEGRLAERHARIAREKDLGGYIRALLATSKDRTIRDFQTYRLAIAISGMATEREAGIRSGGFLSVHRLGGTVRCVS
jgi:hypothetical protein